MFSFPDTFRDGIDTDIADGISMSFFFFRSAFSFEDILYAQCELFEVKWLHEIVIGTERESLDFVYLLREGGKKEEWDIFLSCLQHSYE